MPSLDSLTHMDTEIEKVPELVPIEEDSTADIQKDPGMEKETPEARQIVLTITPIRQNRRLEEK